jgi:hypothetical protein
MRNHPFGLWFHRPLRHRLVKKLPLLILPLFLRIAFAATEPGAISSADAAPTPDQLDFFEKKIRPVLVDKCYKCHSEKAEKVKGGLLLDTREGIRRGGDNGPAVVPGSLEDSLLMEAIRYTNKDFAMPPEKAGGKLPDAIVKDLEAWVKMGAPDPRDGAAKIVKKYDTGEARKWWAFQPVQKPAVPAAKDSAWPRGDIDQFLLAALEGKGLKPVGDADKPTLLRRVFFDLIGLPPTPQQINDFMKDTSPDAYAKVVDRLLASPQFGERWGRHWLDVARYAESSGKDVNITFPNAWRYRDYVIGAFNADKPYDQFLREQIAGDLLPAKDDRQRADQLIATGFLAIGSKSLNEQNPRQFCLDLADEQIDTLSQAMLGLTVACARCHDHKFDPIPQRDYYALAGIFLSTETHYGTAATAQNRHPGGYIDLPKSTGLPTLGKPLPAEERARKEKQLADLRGEQRDLLSQRFAQGNNPAPAAPQRPGARPNNQLRPLVVRSQIGELELELKSYDEYGQPKAQAMGVQDLPAARARPGFGPFGGPGGPGRFGEAMRERPRQRLGGRPPEFLAIGNSPLYARGDVDKPGEKVPRSFPAILSTTTPPAIPAGTSGRRELAEWMTTPQNPLTARVFANRLWHWLFGQGIVESVDNFGTAGKKPVNQPLLDHLATRLVENGWSVKKTIREIVLSHAYQLASTHDPKNFAADPEDTLVWRMSPRRLDAECVRDAMLAASNSLDLSPPIGSLIAVAGNTVVGGRRRFASLSEDTIISAGGDKRSIYLPIAREVIPDALAVFDFAETSLVTGARETTNVPSQALYMLNSPFVTAQAEKLAERVLAAYPAGPNGGASANLDDRVKWAYWLTIGRAPDNIERQAATTFFAKFPANSAKSDLPPAGLRAAANVKAAWTSFCRALFASAEFRYLN